MRKLSFLLPVAAVGALVASTLAVAGPAAAEPWGHGDYGRSERHEHFDHYRRFDRFDRRHHEGRGDWGRHDGGSRYGEHRWR